MRAAWRAMAAAWIVLAAEWLVMAADWIAVAAAWIPRIAAWTPSALVGPDRSVWAQLACLPVAAFSRQWRFVGWTWAVFLPPLSHVWLPLSCCGVPGGGVSPPYLLCGALSLCVHLPRVLGLGRLLGPRIAGVSPWAPIAFLGARHRL